MRISDVNLEPEFVDDFVAKLDEVFLDPTNGLFMVTELVSLGGAGSAFFRNDPENALPSLSHRDGLLSLVTDLFSSALIIPTWLCMHRLLTALNTDHDISWIASKVCVISIVNLPSFTGIEILRDT